jgi:hypothetical protein
LAHTLEDSRRIQAVFERRLVEDVFGVSWHSNALAGDDIVPGSRLNGDKAGDGAPTIGHFDLVPARNERK